MEFRVGDTVEVRSDESGFLGSWFEATVEKRSSKHYLVRYNHLLSESSNAPLKEQVSPGFVRPVPPKLAAETFFEGDAVEAHDRDGWWVGTVIKAEEEDKYTVYFRESREEQKYSASQLRVRQDWFNGLWIRVYEKKNPSLEAVRRKAQPSTPVQVRGISSNLKKKEIVTLSSEEEEEEANNNAPEPEEMHMQEDFSNQLPHSPSPVSDHHVTYSPVLDSPPIPKKNGLKSNPLTKKKSSKNSLREPVTKKKSPPKNARNNRISDSDSPASNNPIPNSDSPIRDEARKRKRKNQGCKLESLRLEAYASVLKAFRSTGPGLTWQQEQLISDLRYQFEIDNDIHIKQLESLDTWELKCECSKCESR